MARNSTTLASVIADERLRITAILESVEGLKRPKSARELALRSNMLPDQATAFLAGLPSESAFLDAMSAEGPVNLTSATAGVGGSLDKKTKRLAEIGDTMKAHNAAKRGAN